MDINQLTPEERRRALEQLKELEAQEKAAKDAEIEQYKALVAETVEESFPRMMNIAEALKATKEVVRDSFSTVIEMKSELYGVKEGQQTHQFMNETGDKRIKIGYYVLDNYDDTVDAGIGIVKEYVQGLAKDTDSRQLVDMLLDLLAKDAKGTLKASKVLKLRKYAERSGNPRFIEGVKIILDAYRPIESKSFIKAEYKNEVGVWVPIPSGLTEA